MEGGEQDKSELPTQFKLKRAREKGTVARGTDLGFLTTLAAFTGWVWVAGASLKDQIQHAAQVGFVAASNVTPTPNAMAAVTGAVLGPMVKSLAFLAAVIFVVVLVFELFQIGGFVFSTEPLKLDFGRLNPGKGLKRVFSLRIVIETAKSILKLLVYGGLAWIAISSAQKDSLPAIQDASSLAAALGRAAFKMLILFVVAGVVFAALDQFIVRREFTKKMRMSRREVRREHRDREGEPRLKQKRKQLHAEFVKASKSLRGIKGADILITNPTHYAVALRYDRAATDAPVVVSRGMNAFALRLKRQAFLYGVTIVQAPPLARALYAGCDLDQEIPEALFQPVADLYMAMRDRTAGSAQGRAHV